MIRITNSNKMFYQQAAKGAIRKGIIAAIKELQCDHTGAKFSEPVSTGDVGGRKLCEALEALLLHGTRHSFLGRIGATFSLSSSAQRYARRVTIQPVR